MPRTLVTPDYPTLPPAVAERLQILMGAGARAGGYAPVQVAQASQPGLGSMSERQRQMEEALRGSNQGAQAMWPPAGFQPPTGGWPSAEQLRPIWEKVRDWRGRTGYPNQFVPEHQEYYGKYIQPWEQYTPPAGLPLSPQFQEQVKGIGKISQGPMDFNAGPQVASVPGGDWGQGGWQPAQAEASPIWEDMYA